MVSAASRSRVYFGTRQDGWCSRVETRSEFDERRGAPARRRGPVRHGSRSERRESLSRRRELEEKAQAAWLAHRLMLPTPYDPIAQISWARKAELEVVRKTEEVLRIKADLDRRVAEAAARQPDEVEIKVEVEVEPKPARTRPRPRNHRPADHATGRATDRRAGSPIDRRNLPEPPAG